MAIEYNLCPFPVPAAADLSTKQFYLVKLDSNGRAALASDGGDVSGVIQNKPAAVDRAASMQPISGGVSKVVCGGTCTAGGNAASDSSGRAVDAASGDFIFGEFLESVTTAGELVSVLLRAKPSTM